MRSNNSTGFLLFLINPFLGGIKGFVDVRKRNSLILIFGWFLVFGMGLSALNERADSYSYVENFELTKSMEFYQYKSLIEDYFSFNSNIKDIYTLTANFFISRFTDNYHVLFLFFALVFGFFYLKSLQFFLRYQIKNNWVFYSLLFIFCFSNPIFNINGVRFWTAAWICVYSTLSIIIDKKYWSLLLLAITPLIHITALIWVLLIGIYFITKRFQKIWVVIFVLSAFISAVSYLDILSSFADSLPSVLQAMIQSYTESERAQEIMDGAKIPLYASILLNMPGYFRLLLSFLLIFNLKKITRDKVSSNLFMAYLIVGSFVNFTAMIPSVGVRFQQLTIPLIVLVWAMNHENLSKYNDLFYLTPIFYAYSVLYWVRNVNSITQIDLYIAPLPFTLVKYLLMS